MKRVQNVFLNSLQLTSLTSTNKIKLSHIGGISKMVKVAINGFGRIGRLALRKLMEQDRKSVV